MKKKHASEVTLQFYDENADAFFDSTYGLDLGHLYSRFLRYIPLGGRILDAGCGSGRDAQKFRSLGYEVEAFDAALKLVLKARQCTGLNVHHMTFNDMLWHDNFDGIWACASLLHVDFHSLAEIFHKFSQALVPSGVVYCSFKHGRENRTVNGRFFEDMDEQKLKLVLSKVRDFEEIETWTTEDVRPEREREIWLNSLLKKK